MRKKNLLSFTRGEMSQGSSRTCDPETCRPRLRCSGDFQHSFRGNSKLAGQVET